MTLPLRHASPPPSIRRIGAAAAAATALLSAPALAGVAEPAGPAPAAAPFDTLTMGFDTSGYGEPGDAWWPEQLVAVDLDGDGDLDVATCNRGNFLPVAPRVSVILNAGDGTFGPPVTYTTPAASRGIAAGDFDADGDVDLVVSDGGDHDQGTTVTVLLNAGDGTFADGVSWSTGAAGPRDLVAADLDGDGTIDLAAANHGFLGQGSTVSVLFGLGDGTFAAPIVHTVGAGPRGLAAGDLDADGDLDLVVARDDGSFGSTSVGMLRNRGDGSFDPAAALPSLTHGGSPFPCLDLADMDADGDLDVVYADLALRRTSSMNDVYAVAVFRNDGAGGFPAVDRHPLGAYTGGFAAIRCGDLDGDGRPEVVGVHDANEGWGVLRGSADGTLGDYTLLPAGEYPRDAEIADVDGDGDQDVLILSHFSQTVTVHYNDGAGTLATVPRVELTGSWFHFDAGDADGDGDLDLVASTGYASNGSIAFQRNLGDGTFGPWPIIYTSPTYSIGVKLRDLDGDGLQDLLWADKYPPYSWRSRLNAGGGQFGPTRSNPDVFTCGVTITDAVQAFDFDGDGDLDVVLMENLGCGGGTNGGERLFLSENDGTGQFTLVNIIQLGWSPYEIMADDLDHDGHLDLIVASRTIEVLRGRGDLTFDPPVAYGEPVAATHAALADVNGDGETDVLAAIPNQNDPRESMDVFLGRGDGTFEPPVRYRATHSPNLSQVFAIAAADVDGDGDIDAVMGNYAANDVSIFRNRGDGTFEPQVHVAAMERVRDVAVADIDGDGRGDLLAMATFSTQGELGVSAIGVLAGRAAPDPGSPDVDGDGTVGLGDLLAVLAAWGPCSGCPADLDGDGLVGLPDLISVLAAWAN